MKIKTFISRRRFLAGISLAALTFRGALASGQEPITSVTAKTSGGLLRGVSTNGVNIFRGVPFAQPPIGSLRFKPPVKSLPWTGERDATEFSAAPCQPGYELVRKSEDCLYLNIWAPEGPGPFPVFVWIHGGGFTGGYAFDPELDGTRFARDGIVVVTIAYRLGVFGFLDFSSILDSGYEASANNALSDLIMALQWIRENIESFGGDPERVTVGGQSAGAKLTDILMGVPSARPLFHQMISESGGAERVAEKSIALAVAEGFARAWTDQTSTDVRNILTAPPETIILAQESLMDRWPQHFPLRCELDPTLLPQLPISSIRDGNSHGKRLLIGTNREESAFFDGLRQIRDVVSRDLGNISLDKFQQVFSNYPQLYPQMTPKELRVRALTAEEYWIPSVRVASAHAAAGGRTWMYRLDFTETSGLLAGFAYHSLELGMVWGKPHKFVLNAAEEAALGTQIHAAWVSFIKGEAPAAAGLPTWPEYQNVSRPTMCLNTTSTIEQNPQSDELQLWDGVL